MTALSSPLASDSSVGKLWSIIVSCLEERNWIFAADCFKPLLGAMQTLAKTQKLRETLSPEEVQAAAPKLLELNAKKMQIQDLLLLTAPGQTSPLVVEPPTKRRTKEKVPGRFADAEATAKAFDETVFVQARDASYRNLFYAKLSEFSKEWKSVGLKFYSPCLPLLNASLIGKSRLLYELAEFGVFVVIWCLRETLDSSYRPPRTKGVADWMEVPNLTEIDFTHGGCHLVLTALGKVAGFLEEKAKKKNKVPLVQLAKEWLSMSMEDENFWENPLAAQTRLSYKRQENAKNSDPLEIVNLYRGAVGEAAKRIDQALEHLLSKPDLRKARGNVGLVFAVDEARRLNTVKPDEARFPWLRRVFRSLPTWNNDQINMFAVVTDTTSTLANFAPSKSHVSSLRVLEDGTDLFEPFTLVMSIDVWFKRANTSLKLEEGSSTQTVVQAVMSLTQKKLLKSQATKLVSFRAALTQNALEEYAVMCVFGRAAYLPLYRERVKFFIKSRLPEEGAQKEAAASLHTFLKAKLLGGSLKGRNENGKFSKAQALSVLGSLVSLEICAATHMAGDLSSEFMRIVAAVSKDRKCLYTLEVSEPLLALAAHFLILEGVITWVILLEKFLSAAVRSTTSVGFRGEVAVQILCVMAWQGVMSGWHAQSNLSFRATTAAAFIEALVFGHLEQTRKRLEKTPSRRHPKLARTAASKPVTDAQLKLCDFLAAWDLFKTGVGRKLSVRVFQFVKTFTKPTARMLLDYYIRGSAIYCQENQEVLDLVIPAFSLAGGQNVSEKSMTFVGIQARLRQSHESLNYLDLWCERVASLPFVNEHLPFVGIFLELEPGMQTKVEIKTVGKGTFFFIRGLLPGDVKGMTDSTHVNNAFNALLQATVDPSRFESIAPWVREQISKMFSAQPYSNF